MRNIVNAILENKCRYLLYLRDNKPEISHPNHWSFLGGGVEENETPLEALERELLEEIDTKVSSIAYSGKIEIRESKECEDQNVFIFTGRINKGLDELTLTEGQKLGYFTPDQMRELKMPSHLKKYFFENMVR